MTPGTVGVRGLLEIIGVRMRTPLPQIMSITPYGLIKFEIKQPTNNPGIAAGVKNGNIVRASETLICITP